MGVDRMVRLLRGPPPGGAGSGSARSGGAPALVIGLARLLAVGCRPDGDAQLRLLVTLDRRLPGAAALLAPHQRELRAGLGVLLLDEAQRQHLALVPAVAREHGGTGHLAAAQDRVERA